MQVKKELHLVISIIIIVNLKWIENKHAVKTKGKLKCYRYGSDTHLANTCDKKK